MSQKLKSPTAFKIIVVFGILLLLGIAIAVSWSGHPKNPVDLLTQKSTRSQVLSSETAHDVKQVKQPVITTKTTTETLAIPFSSTTKSDNTLAKGKSKIIVQGKNGIETLSYKVTYADDMQTDKVLLAKVVTLAPVSQITSIGSAVTQANCDPNYSGKCVPIASDVDCAGGNGNGPAFVSGPVRVIGKDIYHLDGDHDGIGCE